jgi:hypothetical protein
MESGEWTSFRASTLALNPQFHPEKTSAPAHQTQVVHEQAPLSKAVKASAGLGAGMAAAAELEETRAGAVPAISLPRPRFSPSRGADSPKSVGLVSC